MDRQDSSSIHKALESLSRGLSRKKTNPRSNSLTKESSDGGNEKEPGSRFSRLFPLTTLSSSDAESKDGNDVTSDFNNHTSATSDAFQAIRKEKQSVFSAPALLQAPFGKGRPAMDLLALFHNGIRYEFGHMYHMLSMMDRMFERLSHDHISMFVSFFQLSWDYILSYLGAEKVMLFPLAIGETDISSPEFNALARIAKVQKIELVKLSVVAQMENRYRLLPASEACVFLRHEVTAGVVLVLDYMLTEERLFPAILESKLESKQLLAIEKAVFQHMLQDSKQPWSIPNITFRWIHDQAIYKQLVKRHYPGFKRLDLLSQMTKFDAEHVRTLQDLNNAAKEQSSGVSQGEMVPQFYVDKTRLGTLNECREEGMVGGDPWMDNEEQEAQGHEEEDVTSG